MVKFIDKEGIFNELGKVTINELREYWEKEKDNDYCLVPYDSFEEWVNDSIENGYLVPIY